MYSNLEKSIIYTLAYFKIFNYPLTLIEIKKNLIDILETPLNIFLRDLETALNSDNLKDKISHKDGFYLIKIKTNTDSEIIKFLKERQKKYHIADKKFKRAKKISFILSKIPYVKMIAVCNSLGYSNADENSDIDFFIITAKNRIWLTRLISVGLIKILNLRPKSDDIKDKICLSFFVDEKNMNLEKFQLSSHNRLKEFENIKDIYLTYWISQLVPIFEHEGVYNKFCQENDWVKKYLPNYLEYKVADLRKLYSKKNSNNLNVKFFRHNWFEKMAKKIQLKFMNKNLKELMNKDTRVVVNDGVLKLYSIDRREVYSNQWVEIVDSILYPA